MVPEKQGNFDVDLQRRLNQGWPSQTHLEVPAPCHHLHKELEMTKTNQETRHRATEKNHCHPEIRGPGRMSRWTTYFWNPWISTTGDAVRMLAERW